MTRLAATEQVAHAATADMRMRGIATDIGTVMPATIAFLVIAGRNLDTQAYTGFIMHRRTRSDKQETQVVTEAPQHVQRLCLGIDIDLGL